MKKILLLVIFSFFLIVSLDVNAQQWNGYTLYSTTGSSSAYLVDTNGTTFHTWSMSGQGNTGYSSYLMPGGYLWRGVTNSGNSFSGGPITGKVTKADYNGNLLWSYVYSTPDYCTHHDICPMPNGNVLLIAYERKSSAEVAAAGCSAFSSEMWPDKIVEVQPTGATTGTVVWEWHAWDHLVQNTNASAANYQTSILDHPELLNINQNAQKDWMHMNGVDYNPILDQVVFSCHNLNEIYVIDHSTTTAEAAGHTGGNSGKGGDILYRWGKPSNYGATGSTIINVCHDAHWVKEGYPHGGYLGYYNNKGISSTASCGDFLNPPVSGYNYYTPGSAYLPATYDVRQPSNGYNSNMGSIRELPNGNTLVNLGISGTIKEFDPSGTLLWTKSLSGSNAKSFRYDSCYIFNTPLPIPTITEAGGILTSDSATSYQWYLNGQMIIGETNQSYTPTQDGIYIVRTMDASGCVPQYSPGFSFQITIGIQEKNLKAVNLYPNPSTGIVHLNTMGSKNYTVTVFDRIGNQVLPESKNETIDLSGVDNGIYYVSVRTTEGQTLTGKIILIK